MQYIIISDLHIGGDNSLAICHSQAQLASFLRSLNDGPTTLIINGDSFDFLAVEPYGIFSRKAAEEKVQHIIKTPANQALWQGFKDFLAFDKKNRVEITLGNHDVEIVFDEVQEALCSAMTEEGEEDRVQFRTESVSLAGFEVGGVPVRIEHGFQFDPYNWYDLADLLSTTQNRQTGEDFTLPYGSRFVYEVLNNLTPEHPYLPLLKPEPGVFWVMLALEPRAALRLAKGGVGLQLNKYFNSFQSWLTGEQFAETPVDRLGGADAIEDQLMNMRGLSRKDKETVESLKAFIDKAQNESEKDNTENEAGVSFGIMEMIDPTRRGQLALLRSRLRKLQDDRDNFFDFNNAKGDDFQRGYESIVEGGYKVAVLGHSHARKMSWLKPEDDETENKGLLYLNTGTWANILDFDFLQLQTDDGLELWLENLKERNFTPSLVLTYARLAENTNGRGVRVSLEEWSGGKQNPVVQTQDVLPD